ncbi:MAG: MBL fold metallo-hydrolase, partial [Planctomycetota bacterium]
MKTIAAFLVLCLSLFAQDDSKSLRILWIDVEGGAATLIVTPEGGSMLMDCGWPGQRDAERIAAAVKAAGLKQIDHYVVSHFHTDHW